MVEQFLPTSEIRGSKPDIGTIVSTNCPIEKTKKHKEIGNGTSFFSIFVSTHNLLT